MQYKNNVFPAIYILWDVNPSFNYICRKTLFEISLLYQLMWVQQTCVKQIAYCYMVYSEGLPSMYPLDNHI